MSRPLMSVSMDISGVFWTVLLVGGVLVAGLTALVWLLMCVGWLLAAMERCSVCGARRLRRHTAKVVSDGMRDGRRVNPRYHYASCRRCGRRFEITRSGGATEVTDDDRWAELTSSRSVAAIPTSLGVGEAGTSSVPRLGCSGSG